MSKTGSKGRGFRLAAVAMLVAAGLCVSSAPAGAVQLDMSCDEFGAVLLACDRGTANDIACGATIGITWGAAGELANLLCFVQDRRCGCLRNTTDSDRPASDRFIEELASVAVSCFRGPSGDRNLSGMSQQAALATCP